MIMTILNLQVRSCYIALVFNETRKVNCFLKPIKSFLKAKWIGLWQNWFNVSNRFFSEAETYYCQHRPPLDRAYKRIDT